MKKWIGFASVLLVVGAFVAVPAVRSQGSASGAKAMPHSRVAIYRVATGKQLEFLKWLADSDAMDKEAGVPATMTYAHTDGDSWDYLQVAPVLTDAQQAKVDEVTKKHGHKTGFASSLEFRTYISSHTDTFAIGPVMAADLVAEAGK